MSDENPAIDIVETFPGQFTVTDGKNGHFTNVGKNLTVESLLFIVKKLDMSFDQMAFLVLVLNGATPKCEKAAWALTIRFVPLIPPGVTVTTQEVGHG